MPREFEKIITATISLPRQRVNRAAHSRCQMIANSYAIYPWFDTYPRGGFADGIRGWLMEANRRGNRTRRGSLSKLVERVKGIEPSYAAWEAAVLPLNYTRTTARILPPCLHWPARWPGQTPGLPDAPLSVVDMLCLLGYSEQLDWRHDFL